MKIYFGDIIGKVEVVKAVRSACFGMCGTCCTTFRLVRPIFGDIECWNTGCRAPVDQIVMLRVGTCSDRSRRVRRSSGDAAVSKTTKSERMRTKKEISAKINDI